MKTTEETKKYREMKGAELQALILEMQKDLTTSVLKIKAGKLSNSSNVSKVRKSIARATTIFREKGVE